MADRSAIEWTEATWNPLRGCSRVSAGCQHCYAERVAARFAGPGQAYEGLIHPSTGGWNGKIRLVPEALGQPWRWVRPRRIFVNSMTDLFHEAVPFEYIAAVFWVMSVTTRHTYQVLTKRPARMLAFFEWLLEQQDMAIWPVTHEDAGFWMANAVSDIGFENPAIKALGWEPSRGKRAGYDNCGPGWPFENVWLGVSVEDQAAADERIPLLLKCPAAVRWLSCEPLLGPVELSNVRPPLFAAAANVLTGEWKWENGPRIQETAAIDWVVAGGESGSGARPMHPDWARSLRDQCAAAGVPFFFKQWGEWAPYNRGNQDGSALATPNSRDLPLQRFGKKLSGRLLDGAEHNAYPEVPR